MRFHGEDVDLCWRARITGARVIVAPAARVRHRGELELRRPDLNHAVLRARHRMRSIAHPDGRRPAAAAAGRDRRADDRRGRRRRVHRSPGRGVGVDPRVRRGDPACPDLPRPARRDRQAAPAGVRRGAPTARAMPTSRAPVAGEQPAAVVRPHARHAHAHRRRAQRAAVARAVARPVRHVGARRRSRCCSPAARSSTGRCRSSASCCRSPTVGRRSVVGVPHGLEPQRPRVRRRPTRPASPVARRRQRLLAVRHGPRAHRDGRRPGPRSAGSGCGGSPTCSRRPVSGSSPSSPTWRCRSSLA